MNYTTHEMEHRFVVNMNTRKLFYIEGMYYSDDHLTAVMVDDDNRPNLINWDEHSSEYDLFV